jgi:hypothetical protein
MLVTGAGPGEPGVASAGCVSGVAAPLTSPDGVGVRGLKIEASFCFALERSLSGDIVGGAARGVGAVQGSVALAAAIGRWLSSRRDRDRRGK